MIVWGRDVLTSELQRTTPAGDGSLLTTTGAPGSVNNAVSMATRDASPRQKGRGLPRSRFSGRLCAGANSTGPSAEDTRMWPGRGRAACSALITKMRDTRQERAAKSPSWESGDLLAIAQPRAGLPRAALRPLGLGIPQCTVGLRWTMPQGPRSRGQAQDHQATEQALRGEVRDVQGCHDGED